MNAHPCYLLLLLLFHTISMRAWENELEAMSKGVKVEVATYGRRRDQANPGSELGMGSR